MKKNQIDRINIVIPIAGHGSRFRNAGYELPKPMIKAKDKPMVYWATKSFDNIKDYHLRFIYIVLQEHIDKHHIDICIKENIIGKDIEVIVIPAVTKGQSETCLAAKEYIDNDDKLIIYNGDTYSTMDLQSLIKEDVDGIIPCFKSNDPRYSYAKLNDAGYVIEVAEKKVISENATSGLYYFKHGRDFVEEAEKAIMNKETSNNEYYVGPLYNHLIKKGKKIRICGIKENWVLGTPGELEYFIERYHEK